MKLLTLGANGMLGAYIMSYLSPMYDMIPLTRRDIDIFASFQDKVLTERMNELLDTHMPNVVINCAGVTNIRDTLSVAEMYVVNGYFPYVLSCLCKRKNIELIHPSTDCVYSGLEGFYTSADIPNCFNDYGASKAIAETISASIIRVSIIGEEENCRSLVEWVRSKKGSEVQGYTNHLWNGITCLEYAKLLHDIISKNDYWVGIRTYGSLYKGEDHITKYELLQELSRVYNLELTITPVNTEIKCDRTLRPDYTVDTDLHDQILEMKAYGSPLSNRSQFN